MEILKKFYSQYEVYIEDLRLNNKKMIPQKIKVFKLYKNDLYKYEAIFNVNYVNEKDEIVIVNGYGNTENEAMKNLESNILKNKMEFKKDNIEEIFY